MIASPASSHIAALCIPTESQRNVLFLKHWKFLDHEGIHFFLLWLILTWPLLYVGVCSRLYAEVCSLLCREMRRRSCTPNPLRPPPFYWRIRTIRRVQVSLRQAQAARCTIQQGQNRWRSIAWPIRSPIFCPKSPTSISQRIWGVEVDTDWYFEFVFDGNDSMWLC